ncbi:MAG: transketolase [gamma proteobacterium symbiont of Taylorina sp.]|nr:transketolase [gamma proteobacterium symbiont of Taylorina sp.]
MRNQFAETVTELARTDERVVLLSGDIGNRLFNAYKEIAPERFYNCGIAEANMITMAAGLALSGFKPVAYTITPFITTRCLEQIKVDLCYHNLPVILVGTGSGLSYAELGATHHSCEDIAIMRALPNMTVICTADTTEVRLALTEAMKVDGPVYIRMGKKNEPNVHCSDPIFNIGKGISLTEGKDICIIATGNMVATAMEVSEQLLEKQISTKVVSMHTVKPLDKALLMNIFNEYKHVVTLEEHNVVGGFGSAVAEWYVDNCRHYVNLLRIGTPDRFISHVVSQQDARKKYQLLAEPIADKINKVLEKEKI